MLLTQRILIVVSLIVLQNSIKINGENVAIDSNEAVVPLRSCCEEPNSCIASQRPHINSSDFFNSTPFILPRHLFVLNENTNNTGQLSFAISLEQGTLNCSIGKDVSEFSIPLGLDNSFENVTTKINTNGYLEIESERFLPDEFCVSGTTSEEIQIKVCKASKFEDKCEARSQCLRKCCGVGEVYDLSNYGFDRIQCVPSSHRWSPTLYKNVHEKLENSEVALKDIFIVSSHPREDWCQDDPVLNSQRKIRQEKQNLIRILENGTVLVKDHYRKWRMLPPGSFCVDGALNFPGDNSTERYLGDELDTIIIDCSDKAEEEETHTSNPIIYGILQAIASCFLLLTAIVYILLWERQNIHSWTLLGYVIAMFCLYASFTVSYFHVHYWEDETGSDVSIFCWGLAAVTHFWFLSTFCWMTLICFDVWWTFRDLKLTRGNNKRRRRFLGYVLMAIIPPLIVVSVGLCLDHIYGEDIDSDVILPLYGGSKCFMDLEFAVVPYLFLPIGTLLGSNLVFFGVTVYTLYKIGESTKFATTMSSQSQPAKMKLFLFLKLFIVMGVTWTLDLVSWFVFGVNSSNPLMYIVDVLNILQPVAIFIIFVCKKEILRALQDKFPAVRWFVHAVRWNDRTRRSASSVLTDDTNISTSSIRSLSGAQQHISLNTFASSKTNPN